MKLYLDICALKRPFDDMTQARIEDEALAVMEILERIAHGHDTLVWSIALTWENQADPDEEVRDLVQEIERIAISNTVWNESMRPRFDKFLQSGLAPLDATHLVMSEFQNCDVLVTCDDRFIRRAARTGAMIRVMNPLQYIDEVNRE